MLAMGEREIWNPRPRERRSFDAGAEHVRSGLALAALYVASKIDGTPTANSSTRTNGTGRRDEEEEENNGFLSSGDDDDASATNNNEKHSFAIMLSVISGLLYGVNFNPAEKLRLDRSG